MIGQSNLHWLHSCKVLCRCVVVPLKEDVNSHTPEEEVSKVSKDDANNCWSEAGAEDLTNLLQLGGRNILHLSSGMTSSLLTLLSTFLLSLALRSHLLFDVGDSMNFPLGKRGSSLGD